MIEIERKFRLSPQQKTAIEAELQRDYGPLELVHQIDEVFLQGIDSFSEFTPGMPVTRLRTVNGATHLAYKRSINDAGDRIEHEVGIDSADTMRAILLEMDYRPVTVVDKVRLEAKADSMTIVLDAVKGLGDFLEIEVVATSESAIAQAEREIMEKATAFGLSAADIELKKYDQLLDQASQK